MWPKPVELVAVALAMVFIVVDVAAEDVIEDYLCNPVPIPTTSMAAAKEGVLMELLDKTKPGMAYWAVVRQGPDTVYGHAQCASSFEEGTCRRCVGEGLNYFYCHCRENVGGRVTVDDPAGECSVGFDTYEFWG